MPPPPLFRAKLYTKEQQIARKWSENWGGYTDDIKQVGITTCPNRYSLDAQHMHLSYNSLCGHISLRDGELEKTKISLSDPNLRRPYWADP